MKKQLLRYFVVLSIFTHALLAQGYAFSLPADTIPFERTTYNNLLVKAVLNKIDTVKLMFHTASNEVSLTQESVVKLKTIRFDEEVEGVTSWGGNSNTSKVSTHNSVQLQGISWADLPIWSNIDTGQGAEGKIGLGLFNGKVVQLDFDKSLMLISEKLPQDMSSYQKVPLFYENGNLFVDLHCTIAGKPMHNKFMIHSGYSGALLFDDNFVLEHQLDSLLPSVGEKVLRDAFGNAIVSKKVVLPRADMGTLTLHDVAAGFFKSATGLQRISIMGADFLKRFNVVIDADRTFIYIKPSYLFHTAFTAI